MALTPYPASMAETPAILVDAIRYRTVTPQTVHALWHLAGYALERVYPDTPLLVGEVREKLKGVALLDAMDFADMLEAVGDEKLREAKGLAIDWKRLLITALHFLHEWLCDME